jgi:GT2 family glycosyltransferase
MDTDVSIVIISMNNPTDLVRCVKSIFEHTADIKIEVCVVFFNYNEQNLKTVEKEIGGLYKPFFNNGIAGFSENNNLAIKECKGRYILVLNDDTYFVDNSVGLLYNFGVSNNQKLISPVLLNFNGTIQFDGRPRFHILSFMLHELKLHGLLKKYYKKEEEYFSTYNLSGACFLIESDLFRKLGYFDEEYFFTPEDIAIGTRARIEYGIHPIVVRKAKVYHKGSSTAKKIMSATYPTAKQGVFIFFRKLYGANYEIMARIMIFPILIAKFSLWAFSGVSEKQQIMRSALANALKYNFKSVPTKVLFTDLYNQIAEKK